MIQADKKVAATMVLLIVSFIILYGKIMAKLFYDWSIDNNYSHGYLIIPLSLYFIYERRLKLLSLPKSPSNSGLILILISLALLIAGVLGSELFISRISILGIIAGGILFIWGMNYLKMLLFPIAFLILMIPIPAIIFNQISFPLQLLASKFAEFVLAACRIPVLREGNIIHLSNTSLEVVEACSGIRSIISLLTLGIVYGYFMDRRAWYRILLCVMTIPIAIFANGIRVAGTGIATHFYGVRAAEGFFHTFSGWIIFLTAFIMLFLLHSTLRWIAPSQHNNNI
jgi:exosortase